MPADWSATESVAGKEISSLFRSFAVMLVRAHRIIDNHGRSQPFAQ